MKNLKSLVEQRNDAVVEAQAIIESAKSEVRAINETEMTRFNELETQIKGLDLTIKAEERARDMEIEKVEPEQRAESLKTASDLMASFIRGNVAELRADQMSSTANGNIIPTELSGDIIRKVKERSGIFNKVGKITSTGVYKQIVEKDKITAGWTNELAEVTKSDANFDIIEIGHHKLGALAKLPIELINQANFDITSEVMSQMIDSFVGKVEEATIKGTGIGQPTGLTSGGTVVTLNSAIAITADEIIKIYHALKAPYMVNAEWLMSRGTLLAIRLLKDAQGNYIFHEAELTSEYAGYILGKPVMISESMDEIGTGKKPILFGDYNKAYKANINPAQTIQILNEVYASQGAKGVLGFLFLDGKVVNNEAYVTVANA